MERSRKEMNALASLVLRGTTPEEAVTLTWPLVCGQQVAKCTRATAFTGSELTVEVPDRNWRSQLNGYLPNYLHQLTTMTGVTVQKISFVVAHESRR